MQTSPKRQQGLTLISLIVILGFIGFLALLIMKVGPIYMDHSKVVNALAAVKETTDIGSKGEDEIRTILSKRFNMNYVADIKPEQIKITKRGNYLKVEANYEVVQKILGNLSVLVQFDDVVEVGQE